MNSHIASRNQKMLHGRKLQVFPGFNCFIDELRKVFRKRKTFCFHTYFLDKLVNLNENFRIYIWECLHITVLIKCCMRSIWVTFANKLWVVDTVSTVLVDIDPLNTLLLVLSSHHIRLLHTSLRHCQQMTSALCQSTSPDSTTSPAQYFWSSGLLCRRSDGLEFTTGQSPWPGAQQWSFPTTVEDELVPALPLSTHSAVEMLHDSALYKFMIDIDHHSCRRYSRVSKAINGVCLSLCLWFCLSVCYYYYIISLLLLLLLL